MHHNNILLMKNVINFWIVVQYLILERVVNNGLVLILWQQRLVRIIIIYADGWIDVKKNNVRGLKIKPLNMVVNSLWILVY